MAEIVVTDKKGVSYSTVSGEVITLVEGQKITPEIISRGEIKQGTIDALEANKRIKVTLTENEKKAKAAAEKAKKEADEKKAKEEAEKKAQELENKKMEDGDTK